MNPISLLFLALAMSTDAFAAALVKGANSHKPHFSEALRTGLIFGVIEGVTPLIGWAIGQTTTHFVAEWSHWIAFILLLGLGLHMIHAGLQEPEAEEQDKRGQHSFWVLAITAVATSIDALAVGVGLAFIDVNILVAAAAIGLATMTMVTIGVRLGNVIGTMVGQKAEIAGGVVLIIVGSTILYQHFAG